MSGSVGTKLCAKPAMLSYADRAAYVAGLDDVISKPTLLLAQVSTPPPDHPPAWSHLISPDLTFSHLISHLLTPSHTFSHLLTPSHTLSHLVTPSSGI